MSMSYIELRRVFPWIIRPTPTLTRSYVSYLLSNERTDVSQGSSFAVTVDNWNGTWNLWLSDTSKNFLEDKLGLIDYIRRTDVLEGE